MSARRAIAFLAVCLLALCGARAGAVATAAGTARGELIRFGTTTCAPRWTAPNPGRARFRLRNESRRLATVYLFHAASGDIAATVKRVKPRTTRELTVRLHGGDSYAWSCDLHGYPVHVSDTQRVAIVSTPGGPGQQGIPVQVGELIGPLDSYRKYADARLISLRSQLQVLAADIAAGDLQTSEAAWLTAHGIWLELGQDDGAYGAFGELGRSIDGTAAGYAGGPSNRHFTGFHRIELDLWGEHDLAAAGSDTAKLRQLVASLTPARVKADTPATVAALTTFVTRVHEVLEDADRDTLTGADDYGSGTQMPAILADISATREFLTLLQPLLAPRSPGLANRVRRQLRNLEQAVIATRSHGAWVALQNLPPTQRELIDADTGTLLETLSVIPDLLRLGNT